MTAEMKIDYHIQSESVNCWKASQKGEALHHSELKSSSDRAEEMSSQIKEWSLIAAWAWKYIRELKSHTAGYLRVMYLYMGRKILNSNLFHFRLKKWVSF